MTIGPDPMTRTLWISVRLGIGGVPVTRSADGSTGPCPDPRSSAGSGSPPSGRRSRSAQRGRKVPEPLQPLLQGGPRGGEREPEVAGRPERLTGHRSDQQVLQETLG